VANDVPVATAVYHQSGKSTLLTLYRPARSLIPYFTEAHAQKSESISAVFPECPYLMSKRAVEDVDYPVRYG
jgi:hypothetical protein